jgi:hypothetical protein
MHAPVGQFNVGQSGWPSLSPLQSHVQPSDQQTVLNGTQPLWTFWMARTHLVFPTCGVCEKTCRTHIACLPASSTPLKRVLNFLNYCIFNSFSLSRPACKG